MHFTIDQRDGTTIFKLNEDRLDSANVGQLKAEFLILAQPDVEKLIIDLSGVSHIDSAGLSALLLAERQQSAHGGEVRLVGVNENVQSLLRITQLDRIFPMYDSVTEAMEADVTLETSDTKRSLGPGAPSHDAIRTGAIAAGGSLGAAALAGLMMDSPDDEDDYDDDDDDDEDDFDDELPDEVVGETAAVDELDEDDDEDDEDEEDAYSDEDDLEGDIADEDFDDEDDLDDDEDDDEEEV